MINQPDYLIESNIMGIEMLKPNLQNYAIPLLLICFCYLLPSSLLAGDAVRTFQTQQPAENLLPTIAPLYADQAHFTTRNNLLIVKAPESILDEIEQLLNKLDQPLHNLFIEVSSFQGGYDNYQQDSIEGRIKTGSDTSISSRAPENTNPNVTIRYGKDGSVIKTTHTRRNRTQNNPNNYTVRTLEGSWAFIQTGQKVPYYSSNYPNMQRGKYYPPQHSVELIDVTSGFEVYPILNGDRVTLKVRPRNNSMSDRYSGQINTRSADTMVTGRLGEWIYLGGANSQINQNSQGTLYSSNRRSELDMNYRIKVNIID